MLSLFVERAIFTINIYDIAGIQAITNATPAIDVDTDVDTKNIDLNNRVLVFNKIGLNQ